MFWFIVLLVLVLIIFGLGFAVKFLFWVALALFVIWLIALLMRALRGR